MTAQSDIWDELVIGAGSAGCALVHRLTQDPSRRVLLIEAGGTNRAWPVKVPSGVGRAVQSPEHDWGYKSQPDPSRGGKIDICYRGRGLGGSSAINGMVYVRGAPSDYDRWAHTGNDGWDWQSVEPIFRALETPMANRARGDDGPLATRQITRPHSTTTAFLRAAEAAGLPILDDYNEGVQEGVALVELTQKRGLRNSAADAFLRPILSRPNLTVRTECTVERVLIDGLRATGAVIRSARGVEEIAARRIILCAGSINTPKILMLSGIGDAAYLRSLGITSVLDNPHVGRNLREHPLVRLQYATHVPTYNDARAPLKALGHAANFLMHGEGPITGVFEAVGFLRSRPDLAGPDLQLHFLPIAIAQDPSGRLASGRRSGVSVYINKSHPESRGELRLASADPNDAPLIAYKLVESDADIETLVDGMAKVQAMMAEPPISDLIVGQISPDFCVTSVSRAAAADFVRQNAEPAYHPSGTCAMGKGNEAVVTPRLQVAGLEGLFVADASIMPDLISGNTNAACMMIGDRLGRWLLEEV